MKNFTGLSLFFILSLLTTIAYPQVNKDSLLAVWKNEKLPDSTRLAAIDKAAWSGYLFQNPDSGFYYAQIQYDFASRVGNKKQMGNALNTQAVSHSMRGDYPLALDFHTRSLEIRLEIGDQYGTAKSYMNMGPAYSNRGDYVRALDVYKKSLAISEPNNFVKLISTALNNIGVIYISDNDYAKALEYFLQGLKLAKEIKDKRVEANAISNISLIYRYQDELDSALVYAYNGLNIFEEIGDIKGLANAYESIGWLYSAKKEYDKTISFQLKALKIRKSINDKLGLAANMVSLGLTYNQKGLPKQGENWCKKGLEMATSIGSLTYQKSACKCLYQSSKEQGLSKEALDYYQKFRIFSDSLKTNETAKKLQGMEFEKQMLADSLIREEEKKALAIQHEDELRKSRTTRNILIASGLFLVLLVLAIYHRMQFIKKSRKEIAKERDRSESLLLNILPQEIAEELKANGKAEARDFDMVSILFTDFKGFTQLSEKLTAKELVSEINICFKAFDEICGKYQIEKIKTIGDAYMAAGGLPIPNDNSTKNTVLAALEMQHFVQQRMRLKKEKGELGFEMRVGIHTGPIVAGIVGVKKFQYDIWGDTVNTASRIESNGTVGKVNISENTYQLLKNDPGFDFVSRGEIDAKGKGEINMYYVDIIA